MGRYIPASVLIAGLFFVSHVGAGSFEVSPVRVSLSADTRTAALIVNNVSAEATSVQVEMLAWLQKDGKDEYTPTQDILVTPPIFNLPQGKSQVIRLGLLHPVVSSHEGAYRLVLQELPSSNASGNHVHFTMRISIPVFVAPTEGTAQSLLEWKVERVGLGRLKIHATNRGNKHIQISKLKLQIADSETALADIHEMKYLLPNQSYQWTTRISSKIPQKDGTLRISAQTDDGLLEARVPFWGNAK